MVPCIILELEEEEEEMTPNLRVGLKKRQRKRLSESLPTALFLLKGLARRYLPKCRSRMFLRH